MEETLIDLIGSRDWDGALRQARELPPLERSVAFKLIGRARHKTISEQLRAENASAKKPAEPTPVHSKRRNQRLLMLSRLKKFGNGQ